MSQLSRNESGQVDRWHTYPTPTGQTMAVNERLANAVLHHLPQINPGIRAADKFWKAVGPLVLVGGFVALIWWPWWTPIVGFVLASLIYRSALKSAADFVADAAKADPALCQSLEAAGVIRTA